MLLRLIVSIVVLIVSGAAQAQTIPLDRLRGTSDDMVETRLYSSDSELKLMTLNQAIAENPQNPELLLRKGIYLQELGRMQQSIDVFEALRAEYPNHPAPYINLASIFAQQGRLEEARQMLTKSEALNPGRYQTQLGLASINIGLALEAIKKANDLNSGDIATEERIRELEQLIAKLNAPPLVVSAAAISEPIRVENLNQSGLLPKLKKIGGNPKAKISPNRDRLTLNAPTTPDRQLKQRAFGGDRSKQNHVMSEVTDEARVEIMNMVESWAAAWSRRDLVEYSSYYSPQFKAANGMPRDSWSLYKKNIINHAKFIDVRVNIKQIKILKNKAWVQFSQRYRSDIYSDSARKEMKLISEDGVWKIIGEKSIL
ncbi:MAG: tetratricopeptide repeat protein [Betaproteobacteria bacterium]|nr:tetratricopeptide repeat protein [Betaproteobacteria bacterium]